MSAKKIKLEEKLRKDEEKRKQMEEKKRQLEEKERLKAAERQKREEERRQKEEEKRMKDEEKRKQMEEKKRQLEEKERLKSAEKQKREEERRAKEEERRLKEEERMKKMDEKRRQLEEKQRQEDEKVRQQEEERKKKEKSSQKFKQFFKVQSSSPSVGNNVVPASEPTAENAPFKPFQLKPNQTLAKIVPDFVRENFILGAFDSLVGGQYESEELYLNELKFKHRIPFRTGRRLRTKNDETDVILLDDQTNAVPKLKVKLLQFHDNNRPAWFGTWKKRSKHVTGRRPFGQDKRWFDYEVDSDEEWEEEEPEGESLAGSDNEEPEDDYEIDNEFMVPHGYLSDGEEEESKEVAEGSGTDADFREKEMIARKNMRIKPLHPIAIGCIWNHNSEDETAATFLKKYQIVFNTIKS